MKAKRKHRSTKLTPNQAAVLAALAEGLSVVDVAADWDVSQTVVYRTIEQARAKLGAKTIPHATAIWMRRQLEGSPSATYHSRVAVNGATPHE